MGFFINSLKFFRLRIAVIVLCVTVVAGWSAAACEISSITPSSGLLGDTLTVSVQGVGFSFIEFSDQGFDISFGPGIQATITNLLPATVVPLPQELVVDLVIDAAATPGPRTVTVTSLANEQFCSQQGFTVTASGGTDNVPPLAQFSFSPSSPHVGEAINFDASGSVDPDGQIVQFLWDFGDGTFGQGVNTSHTYLRPESYVVALTVVDDQGAEGMASQPLVLQEGNPDNLPPVADFVFAPDSPDAGDEVEFDASDSFDPDGQVVQYIWDFGDGTMGDGMATTHAYAQEGFYQVNLVVIDNQEASDNLNLEVEVLPSGSCVMPAAAIGFSPQQVKKCPPTAIIAPKKPTLDGHGGLRLPGFISVRKTRVTFDGTASHDNDEGGKSIVRYDWIVKAGPLDPNPEAPSAAPLTGKGPTITVTFNAPGTYEISLTVTDNEGQQNTAVIKATLKNKLPWIRTSKRRIVVDSGGAFRKAKIRWKAKDRDYPDKVVKTTITGDGQGGAGAINAVLNPKNPEGGTLGISFGGNWAFLQLKIDAEDQHKAKGTYLGWEVLWKNAAGHQAVQAWVTGPGAGLVNGVLTRMLQNAGLRPGTPKFRQKLNRAQQQLNNCIAGQPVCRRYRVVEQSGATPLTAASVHPTQEDSVEEWELLEQSSEEVAGNVPIVTVEFSPTSPRPGESIAFTASNALPSEGGSSIIQYEWDFNGDGKTDATGPTATFQFPTPGEFDVALHAVDDQGAETTQVQTVTVEGTTGDQTIAQALDTNHNNVIDDTEIRTAIQLWISGQVVPGTTKTIDDATIRRLIQLWISGGPVAAQAQALVAPAPLRLDRVSLASKGGQFALNVAGQGIRKTNVQVFDLAGRRVLDRTSESAPLRFEAVDTTGRRWANGVYLYVVAVYGEDGSTLRSELRKFVVLR